MIYDDLFIEKAKLRWKNNQRREVDAIAFQDEYKNVREEIEKWINLIPDTDKRASIVGHLRADNWREAYHELAVGQLFKQLGFTVEYDKPIINPLAPELPPKTPDWFVYIRDSGKIYIEVFTNKAANETSRDEKVWGTLFARIKNSIEDVAISLIQQNNIPPSLNNHKQIVVNLKDWLKTNPAKGERKKIADNIIAEFLFTQAMQKPTVLMFSDAYGSPKAIPSLESKIMEKVKRYQFLEDIGIPFAVAIIPNDILTGADLTDLQSLLYGKQVYDVDTGETFREGKGLFASVSSLSAIFWIPKMLGLPLSDRDVKLFPNQHATNLLHEIVMKTFDGIAKS